MNQEMREKLESVLAEVREKGGANVTVRSWGGPVAWCAMNFGKHREGMDALREMLALGASPDQRMYDGTTALMCAAGRGQLELCSMLMEAGADLEAENDSGETALSMSVNGVGSERKEIVEFLLLNGADPNHGEKLNTGDAYGITPLVLAVDAGWRESAIALVMAGAEISGSVRLNRKGTMPVSSLLTEKAEKFGMRKDGVAAEAVLKYKKLKDENDILSKESKEPSEKKGRRKI